MALRSERSSLAETDAFVVLFHFDDGRSLTGKMKCVERKTHGKWKIPSGAVVYSNNGVIASDGGH